MHSTKQTPVVVLGLALVAAVANAQTTAAPAPPIHDPCTTCLATNGKTLPACADVIIPYTFTADTLLSLTPAQLVCACALGTTLDWTNSCTSACEASSLNQVRTTLTQAKPLLCRASTTGTVTTTAPGATPTKATPSGPTPTKPSGSASMTRCNLAATAVVVLLAAVHAFF